MKKNLHLVAILFLVVTAFNSAYSQTTLFNADFSNAAGDNNWVNNTGSDWLRGTDATAHGAGKYFYIERSSSTGQYFSDSNSYVDSPTIDLTGYELLTLSLRVNLDTEASYDGLRILFSNDGGTTFNPLGKFNDEALNWYNDAGVNAFGTISGLAIVNGWSGNSGGWYTATIDLPSQGFDNRDDIIFSLQFASDDSFQDIGVAVDDFKITGYPVTTKVYPDCGIGIGDKLELWLNPTTLSSLSDGDKVSRWPNRSAINPDWTDATSSGTLMPTYNNNETKNVNFNPVVSFDSTNAMFGKQGFYNSDIFIVINPGVPISSAAATEDVFMGDDYLEISPGEDVTGVSVNDTSVRFGAFPDIVAYNQGANDSYGRAIVSNTIAYDRPVIFNARLNADGDGMDLYLDGINLGVTLNAALVREENISTFKDILNSRYWLGRSEFFGPSFSGDVLEVMAFSERKSDIDRKRIESYLGIKYGITLGLFPVTALGIPHIPGEYYDSAGNALWNAALHTNYTYNVAGIGRDDCSLLYQKQAKSIDPNTFITIGLGDIYATNDDNPNTFANNGDFLIWGSTLSTLTALPTPLLVNLGPSLVTTFTEVSERTWKFVETTTTDIPEVKLSVSTAGLSSLPPLTGNDAYVMIVADDDAFTTNVETVFLKTNGASQQCFYDFDDTKFVKFGVAHEVVSSRHIEFDGTNDYVKIGDELNQTGAFSISAWIYTSGSNDDTSEKTIVSKRGSGTDGYHFYLSDANKLVMQYGALPTMQIESNTTLNENQWRYVAFTFNGTKGKLYIDGVEDNENTMIAPTTNTNDFCIGARYVNKTNIINHFKGNLEEIRLFDDAISVDELRFIMNQEIAKNGTLIEGAIIPNSITKNDLNGRTWSTLQAYFNMNTYIGTHLNDVSGNGHRGALLVPENFNIREQTAPLPYVASIDGDWSTVGTWENGSTQYLPYDKKTINGVDTAIAWNIVETQSALKSSSNQVLLGLINSSDIISVENDTKLEISHYLKIEGQIDLVGKSQLVQTLDSDLDKESTGTIKRDQQGQSNLHNYNYWSLPVGNPNATSNNNDYSLETVLKDGTTDSPEDITWIDGYDGIAGPPISLSRFWLYKYDSNDNSYYNWQGFDETDELKPGQGFSMKGSNAATATQNYTFVGKPFNGSITHTVGANQSILIGNPYASALNATTFITNNNTSITGTLYFWEHFSTNNTHVTVDYQGGYAMRNLTGGIAPVSPPELSGLGSSTKEPNQFIPVGQGFFVAGSAIGGTITFNNNQRLFIKENNASSNTVFRNESITNNNADDTFEAPNHTTLRLSITAVSGHKRQLLLGFIEDEATNNYDYGYDGELYDVLPSDAYFTADNHHLIIQGVGAFNDNENHPITVKSNTQGLVTFTLDGLENNTVIEDIYIHDNETNLYYNIVAGEASILVNEGVTENRFSLRFKNESVLSVDEHVLDVFSIQFIQNQQTILIQNTTNIEALQSVTLTNILGQNITRWNLKGTTGSRIELPVKNVSSGAYLIQLKTVSGKQKTKKVIIH